MCIFSILILWVFSFSFIYISLKIVPIDKHFQRSVFLKRRVTDAKYWEMHLFLNKSDKILLTSYNILILYIFNTNVTDYYVYFDRHLTWCLHSAKLLFGLMWQMTFYYLTGHSFLLLALQQSIYFFQSQTNQLYWELGLDRNIRRQKIGFFGKIFQFFSLSWNELLWKSNCFHSFAILLYFSNSTSVIQQFSKWKSHV